MDKPALYTVIGAGGFVGSRLAASLRQDGHAVYTPGRGDAGLLGRPLGRVLYCAGMTADYASRPAETVEAHAGLLARLLQQADFEHLVYLSSTRLYDGLDSASEDVALPLRPAAPRHLYDLSKALGENLCLTAAGGRAAVARLSCVYDWQPGAPGFLSEWLQRAAHSKTLQLDSSSGVLRDYIHLDDVVLALRAMSSQRATGIVNVASGENISNAGLAALFAQHGWTVTFNNAGTPQQAPACPLARLAVLGVVPRPVRDVLAACLTSETYLAAH
jgi:nucleoside-diphosphate-sugar epimerase